MDAPAGQATPGLKGRQLECMLLAKDGLSSKHIARELGISPRTVDSHIAAALKALDAPNRTAGIARLYELDIAAKPAAGSAASPPAPPPQQHSAPHDPAPSLDPAAGDVAPSQPAFRVLPPLGGSINLASRPTRARWMLRIALICLMIGSAFILTVLGIIKIASGSVQ